MLSARHLNAKIVSRVLIQIRCHRRRGGRWRLRREGVDFGRAQKSVCDVLGRRGGLHNFYLCNLGLRRRAARACCGARCRCTRPRLDGAPRLTGCVAWHHGTGVRLAVCWLIARQRSKAPPLCAAGARHRRGEARMGRQGRDVGEDAEGARRERQAGFQSRRATDIKIDLPKLRLLWAR